MFGSRSTGVVIKNKREVLEAFPIDDDSSWPFMERRWKRKNVRAEREVWIFIFTICWEFWPVAVVSRILGLLLLDGFKR